MQMYQIDTLTSTHGVRTFDVVHDGNHPASLCQMCEKRAVLPHFCLVTTAGLH